MENILYDDVLLHLAEHGEGGEVLRFWEPRELFIVLGRISKEARDINIEEVRRDRIPVLRRPSGGGTVLQGKGCLNYSLILSKNRPQISDLKNSYQFILNKVILTLKKLSVEAGFFPVSDVALIDGHKKISGNAQKRSRQFILHHGTLLFNFGLNNIEKYLKIPEGIPEYRGGRSHLEFVANIPSQAEEFKSWFCKMFDLDRREHTLTVKEKQCLASFLENKKVVINV